MLFVTRNRRGGSEEIGCFGVVTHPLDDDVRHLFYRRFGFHDLPFNRAAR